MSEALLHKMKMVRISMREFLLREIGIVEVSMSEVVLSEITEKITPARVGEKWTAVVVKKTYRLT
jgi:hypothetical protein